MVHSALNYQKKMPLSCLVSRYHPTPCLSCNVLVPDPIYIAKQPNQFGATSTAKSFMKITFSLQMWTHTATVWELLWEIWQRRAWNGKHPWLVASLVPTRIDTGKNRKMKRDLGEALIHHVCSWKSQIYVWEPDLESWKYHLASRYQLGCRTPPPAGRTSALFTQHSPGLTRCRSHQLSIIKHENAFFLRASFCWRWW